jgi:uncharacterized protein (DUF1697 family)
VKGNSLERIATNPSRMMIAFLADAAGRKHLAPLQKQDWSPDALAVGAGVAYIWCANGLLESPLADAVARALKDGVTIRNWATVLKLHALAG